MNKIFYKKGFTLVEIMIAMGIFTGLVVLLTTFQKDVFTNNVFIQNSLIAESEARGALKREIAELRAAAPSNDGLYPIAVADKNTLTFFSDINKDGLREKVRYFVANSSLLRGITKPTGAPYTYSGNEIISTVVHNIVNPTSTPVFDFYDGSSSLMSFPVNVVNIRLVKMTIMINSNPVRSSSTMTFTSQVTIRNIKDNL